MTDEHQVHAIVATAICHCQKEHPDREVDPEEATRTAKCIIAALTDAGLQIVIAAQRNLITQCQNVLAAANAPVSLSQAGPYEPARQRSIIWRDGNL